MPPSSTSLKSIFGLTAKQHAQELNLAGVVTNKGRPRRASASRGRSKEKSSPLLESQVTAHISLPLSLLSIYRLAKFAAVLHVLPSIKHHLTMLS